MVVIKVYNMEERYSIIAKNAPIYRKARKKEKTQILNELHEHLPTSRSYIAYLLRNTGKKVYLKGGKVVLVGKYSKELLSRRGKHNLIVPQMKVVEKHRINGKKIKRYEIDTPLNRVLRAEGVSEEVKRRFVSLRDNIKIVKLTQAIIKLQMELDRAYNKKRRLEWASELQ
jgi:hypothetical protein